MRQLKNIFLFIILVCQLLIIEFNYIQMPASKQPKPFLKKGTRQFLSNATVRSLNQKPKIVEFGDQGSDFDFQKTNNSNAATFGKRQEEQIQIQIKKTSFSRQTQQKGFIVSEKNKPKQNKPMNEQKIVKNQMSGAKKKPALLQDYIGGNSTTKSKNQNRNSFSRQKNNQPIKNETNLKSMVETLYKQEQELEDSNEQAQKEKGISIPIRNNQTSTVLIKTNFPPKIAVQKKIYQPQKFEPLVQQIINFKEQSDEENQAPKAQNKKIPTVAKNNQKPKYSSNKWDEEEEQVVQKTPQPQNQVRAPSKLLQKYYKKQPVLPQKTNVPQQVKIQLKDIPNQLKQQIINQYLHQHKSSMSQKLQELQELTKQKNKQKQKFQEENKRLNKQREQFAKQLLQKTKQFEQLKKNEINKLNRQKKYMKDQQMSGKEDRDHKKQIGGLRQKLFQSQEQKKKAKNDYKIENDRLRKKLQQILEQNQNLKQQMKLLQKQKVEVKQKSKKIEKQVEQFNRVNYWQGAPTKSYIQSFADNQFTLFDYDMVYFNIQSLEHYQFYLSKKDEQIQLISEDESNGKIIRKYRNGKEQIQYVNKILKENFPFPFKFSVLTYLNGDVKLAYPNGIQIFYDSRNNITQFKINDQKTIYNFHKLGQLEMKFRHGQRGEVHELRKSNMMVRNSRNGEQKLKKCENGMIQRLI